MRTFGFEIKMGHLAAVRMGRGLAADVGLTPARLDMVRAVFERGRRVVQSRLWKVLGVSKVVVSVMVRAIERLGFVQRRMCAEDRRTWVIELTTKGEEALREVFYADETMGFLPLQMGMAFGPNGFQWPGLERRVARAERFITPFSRQFGRGHQNPWTCTEDDEGFYFEDVPGNPVRLFIVPTWDERQDIDPDAPERIEDEPWQYCPYTGRPLKPKALLEQEAKEKEEARIAKEALALANADFRRDAFAARSNRHRRKDWRPF